MRALPVLVALVLAGLGAPSGAQQAAAVPTPMPEDSAVGQDCAVLLQEAEAGLQLGLQAIGSKRWKEAQVSLKAAAASFLKVAAGCPAQAIQASKQRERASAELSLAEAGASHQGECQPRLDKALELDIRATLARNEKGDPVEVERLLGEAETVWREAASLCHSPHREKAERSLAATIRARTANAELLSSGPACEAALKNANALVEFARTAWKDKRWDDAGMLYGKAVLAWEGAADKCTGSRQQQAQRKVEQTQVDAHNAEFCGPLWDAATEHSQRLKAAGGSGATVTASEKDILSFRAEVAWREATSQCRGTSQGLARNNADAVARERGTPLPPQAMTLYASRKVLPPASVVVAPPGATALAPAASPAISVVVPPLALVAEGAIQGPAKQATPLVRPAVVVTSAVAQTTPPTVQETRSIRAALPPQAVDKPAEKSAVAPPVDGVFVAGESTYRGAFVVDRKSGAVSGSGTVEWANGERFVGSLVDGRREGKGRFEWPGGQWYEGNWSDDKATGQGVIQYVGGNRYEGAVVDGEPQGKGSLVFPSGDRYTGEFVRGVFHGQGTYAWKNGNRYDGSWSLGKKHGQGRLTWASGEGWEGEFKDDQRTEAGKSIAAGPR